MKIKRKFNLAEVGLKYESIEIEVSGHDVPGMISLIHDTWFQYVEAIKNKRTR